MASSSCLSNAAWLLSTRGSFLISAVVSYVFPPTISLTWYVPGAARGPEGRPPQEIARGTLEGASYRMSHTKRFNPASPESFSPRAQKPNSSSSGLTSSFVLLLEYLRITFPLASEISSVTSSFRAAFRKYLMTTPDGGLAPTAAVPGSLNPGPRKRTALDG